MKFLRALPLVAALGLMGCSGEPSGSGFKVALITPGPVSDAGWNAMAYDALKNLEGELGAEVNNQEATGTKIKDALRTYAQQDYDLVFGHGYEYNAPSLDVAMDFPKTVFITSSGGGTAKNVGAFRFYLEQGFYLAGMAAASMSKTGKVGVVGLDVPSIRSTFEAFRAGAKAVNPQVEILQNYQKDSADLAAYKQATLTLIDAGADMIIHQANQSAQAVFNACKERGVYAFGSNADQNANSSGVVIASAVIVAKPAFLDLAKQVKEGKYTGNVTLMGMDKGAIDFVWNPSLRSKVPVDLMTKIEDAKKKMVRGELVAPKADF